MKDIHRLETITQAHEFMGVEKPKHPLVSIFCHEKMYSNRELIGKAVTTDMYQVVYKMNTDGSFGYGRNTYDFQEGTMLFLKPGQVITMPEWEFNESNGGWSLFFHPDLIRKSPLGHIIDDYSFFSYDANEALHLSDDEKQTIAELRDKIVKEYSLNIDKHSQKLIVGSIEMMLDYCTRFYDRQFYTRENINKDLVSKFEHLLKKYYNSGLALKEGVPTVKYCGAELNISGNYLSDLLKKETGRNAQDHIHSFVIEQAKNRLVNSTNTVSEIAYDLGFEYPQYFSRLFKKKTGQTPLAYRTALN
ncbi:AraC family transcriptional regulator [Ancylomarina sp. 16SWW S1-10-2]|uniref:helix-turn-helix domain-containing protein n=1 Tax=Ancylomarina sp. 16SWW S1-10-2 TaxID=2499681 RepID=UPI0012AD25E9|nr:helix-turn-helix domain-containing protein [Ancylomarina sp. 16SWW S1-10-2]MRT92903.1 AraC family transcriptional regulator [Ancylomarina sp. 16SWW S1-10-2]